MKTRFLITAAAVLLCGCGMFGKRQIIILPPENNTFENSEHVNCRNGVIQISNTVKNLFSDNFGGPSAKWEQFSNAGSRLSFKFGEYRGINGLTLTLKEGNGSDTAFELTSKVFKVSSGSRFALNISAMGNLDLSAARGRNNFYLNRIEWLDAGDDLVATQDFSYKVIPTTITENVIRGQVPDNVVAARIRIGMDSPNFTAESFLVFSDVSFMSEESQAKLWPTGNFISRPFKTPAGGRIMWDADVPSGCVVALQLSTAPDVNGVPGHWSAFVGPDNNPARAYLTSGAALPYVDAPWMRYKVIMKASEGRSPVVKSVQIGNVYDSKWNGNDLTPPEIAMLTPVVFDNPSASVSFKISDNTLIDWRTLEMDVDGVDVTPRVVRNGNTISYKPTKPFAPVVKPFAAMSYWRQVNLGDNLTVEHLASQGNAVRFTRDANMTDTMFTLISPRRRVAAGAIYDFKVELRHNLEMTSKSQEDAPVRIYWVDKDDKQIGDFIGVQVPVTDGWKTVVRRARAPENAAYVEMQLGFDNPNIFGGKYFDCRNASIEGPEPTGYTRQANYHVMYLKVADFAGNITERHFNILIDKPVARGSVSINEKGFLKIDGKPFFPIGIYAVCQREFNEMNFDNAFRDLKAAGFNTAHTYSTTRNAVFSNFIGSAEKYGFKLFLSSSKGANSLDEQAFLKDVSNELQSSSMLAWYLADDTSSHVSADKLRDLHKAVKQMDPAHITMQADPIGDAGVSHYRNYVNSTDGFMPEIYPFEKNVPREVAVPTVIKDMMAVKADLEAAGNPPKTIWPILEFFDGRKDMALPNNDDLRVMSYLSIIHGANGIVWYTYGGFEENHGVTSSPERWNGLCRVSREFSYLQDVFTSANVEMPAPKIVSGPKKDALGYDSISMLCRFSHGKYYLICANSSAEQVTASFKTPVADVATVLFENREIRIYKRGFKDVFEPFAVHVYELKDMFK